MLGGDENQGLGGISTTYIGPEQMEKETGSTVYTEMEMVNSLTHTHRHMRAKCVTHCTQECMHVYVKTDGRFQSAEREE